MKIKYKIWLEKNGKVLFGKGLLFTVLCMKMT
jgi:hypothetical protein